MANQRIKISKALDIQESIEGKSNDIELLRFYLKKITMQSEWNTFVNIKWHSYGKLSYESHRFYYPTKALLNLNLKFKALDIKRYFNFKSGHGTETVDELSKEDFKTSREFFKELGRLKREYHIAGMPVYISQRPCKDW